MTNGAKLVRIGAALAIVCALAEGSSQASVARPSCALGKLSAHDAQVVQTVLTQRRAGFQRSLVGVSPSSASAAGEAFVTDLAAWLYGYPIVLVRRTILTFPRNQMVAIAGLVDPTVQTVVAPNHDTLYSVGQIDLSAGPIVIQTPPTAGRYSVVQLTDAVTDVAAYVGDGAAARTGETAVLVAPGWRGTLPPGLVVVRPATSLLWLLGRTLVSGPSDTAAAVALLSRYSLTPLGAFLAGTRDGAYVLPAFPAGRTPVSVPGGATFFDELGRDLAADPPPASDGCAIAAFAGVGIGAGRSPSTTLTGLASRALSAAAAAGHAVLDQLVAALRRAPSRVTNGWSTTTSDTGRFGTHYLDRALVAAIGLGANTTDRALYLSANRDSARRPLTGGHVYRLTFRPGRLPPVSAFWSLTLYDSRILLYANPLDRYSIGDRTAGLRRDAAGGLTIVVSHAPPGAGERANWLPAPAGRFELYLRLYEPTQAARSRRWKPPSIVCIS